MTEKIRITVKREHAFSMSSIDGDTLAEVAQMINDLIVEHGAESILDYEYGYDSDPGYFNVLIQRDETDEEYRVRTERLAMRNEALRNMELTKLRELMRKYPEAYLEAVPK